MIWTSKFCSQVWNNKKNLAWVKKPTINMEKPTVVDEDDLLMKVDSMKAKLIYHQKQETIRITNI